MNLFEISKCHDFYRIQRKSWISIAMDAPPLGGARARAKTLLIRAMDMEFSRQLQTVSIARNVVTYSSFDYDAHIHAGPIVVGKDTIG